MELKVVLLVFCLLKVPESIHHFHLILLLWIKIVFRSFSKASQSNLVETSSAKDAEHLSADGISDELSAKIVELDKVARESIYPQHPAVTQKRVEICDLLMPGVDFGQKNLSTGQQLQLNRLVYLIQSDPPSKMIALFWVSDVFDSCSLWAVWLSLNVHRSLGKHLQLPEWPGRTRGNGIISGHVNSQLSQLWNGQNQ